MPDQPRSEGTPAHEQGPGERPRLSSTAIERIRRERLHPTRTQWDYLHLRGIRDALAEALGRVPHPSGDKPTLDLYCGAKPYASLSPAQPVLGYDIDDHFGAADAVGGLPLPYDRDTFSVVLCTQAIHLVDDPSAVVSEMERVLVPDGWAVVTVPHIFRRDLPYERKLTSDDLRSLFPGWRETRVEAIRGPGTGGAYIVGKVVAGAARRWPWLRPAVPVAALAINALGALADWLTRPLWHRYPAALLVVARPPDTSTDPPTGSNDQRGRWSTPE